MEIQDLQTTETPTVSDSINTTKEGVHKIPLTATEIQAWIVSYLAELLEINPDEIDITIPFDRYGLDSAVVVGLTGDLEAWLGCKLDPTLIYDYPTIEVLARHLAEELSTKI